jgi:transposase
MERPLNTAPRLGPWRQVTSLRAILAVMDGQSLTAVAWSLRVHARTVAAWVCVFCGDGRRGAPRNNPTGRPPKLTPTPQAARAIRMDAGPVQAGVRRACWRSPLVPPLLDDRGGGFDHVCSMAPWLKPLGVSSQQAAFISAPLDEGQRPAWCTTTWPPRRRLAKARKALRLWGDDASCPPWGTLAYTWARRGHQPLVKTSGTRTGDTVVGRSEYVTGRFWYQGLEGRLHSEAYSALLTPVLAQTTPPLLLSQEGARYHPSAARQRFCAQPRERLTVCQLPSDAPDDNPIAKLWKNVTKEGTHRHYFPTGEALTDQVEHALLTFATMPAESLARCRLPPALAQAASGGLVRKTFS